MQETIIRGIAQLATPIGREARHGAAMRELSFTGALATCLRKARNSWWRWRGLQDWTTLPVAISNAANSVVVPLRL